jgi:hypothetical protein
MVPGAGSGGRAASHTIATPKTSVAQIKSVVIRNITPGLTRQGGESFGQFWCDKQVIGTSDQENPEAGGG